MAPFVLSKSGITDDVAPTGAGYASRTFTVPTTVDDGTGRQSGVIYIRPELKTAGGVTVTNGTLTISLWLKIGGTGGTWTQIGDPQTIPRGRRIPMYFGDLDIDTPGALQITAVTGSTPAVAASVDLTCDIGAIAAGMSRVGPGGVPLVQPYGFFSALNPVLGEGDETYFRLTQAGALRVAEMFAADAEDNGNDAFHTIERACADTSALSAPWTPYSSGTTLIGTAGVSVKVLPGRIRAAGGVNTHATNNYFLVLVDKASAAVNNDAAVWAIPLASVASFGLSGQKFDFPGGLKFATGLAYAISTTPHKVTLPATLDCVVFLAWQ